MGRGKNRADLAPAVSAHRSPEEPARARADRVESRVRVTSQAARGRVSKLADQFHPATIECLRETPLARRKALGQYFTPKTMRERLFDLLPKKDYLKILDPAAGTGEFLGTARERYPESTLEGWEIDAPIASVARRVATGARIRILDALENDRRGDFDLVIGNPPYFEFNPPPALRHRFADAISGRANIFSFFIARALSLLGDDGVLAFVVPQSMNNGAYFRALRQYILARGGIVALEPFEEIDLFADAQQTVMLLVVQKGLRSDKHVFRKNGIEIFTPDPARLEKLFKGKTTLGQLGFSVRTGRIVWNQHKVSLTGKKKGAVPLLWAHNISRDGLAFPARQAKKPQYIRTEMEPDRGPAIIVNRITGAGSKAMIRCAVVPEGMKFFAENHVNVVYPPEEDGKLPLFRKNKAPSLASVAAAIQSPDAIQTARLVTGNTQISATELLHLVSLSV